MEYSIIHNYNIKELYDQLATLKINYDSYRGEIRKIVRIEEKVDEYLMLFNQTYDRVIVKFRNMLPRNRTRNKRGLVNGLGSIIKAITGNLDEEDREKYEKIIGHLQDKQTSMEKQVKHQYAITESLINSYNKTIAELNFNNKQIHEKLKGINREHKFESALIDVREVLDHMQLLLNSIDHAAGEIETAFAFCKLGKLHPSIISTENLKFMLNQILNKTKESTVDMFEEDMLEYETLIKVDCGLSEGQIVFMLNLPMYKKEIYSMINIKPIPVPRDDQYVSIIPKFKYYLLNGNKEIIALNNKCTKISKNYYCNWEQINPYVPNCEKNIVLNNNIEECALTKYSIEKTLITVIPEINQLLIVSKEDQKLVIKNNENEEIKTVRGTILIRPEGEEIYLRNSLLIGKAKFSGKPIHLEIKQSSISLTNIINETFILKDYSNFELKDISWKDQEGAPTEFKTNAQIGFIVISITIILIVMYLITIKARQIYKTYTNVRNLSSINSRTPEPREIPLIRKDEPKLLAPKAEARTSKPANPTPLLK